MPGQSLSFLTFFLNKHFVFLVLLPFYLFPLQYVSANLPSNISFINNVRRVG